MPPRPTDQDAEEMEQPVGVGQAKGPADEPHGLGWTPLPLPRVSSKTDAPPSVVRSDEILRASGFATNFDAMRSNASGSIEVDASWLMGSTQPPPAEELEELPKIRRDTIHVDEGWLEDEKTARKRPPPMPLSLESLARVAGRPQPPPLPPEEEPGPPERKER